MFEQHAGKDLVAQLEFMADQGFRALEDNGMKGQSPEMQEKIGKTLDDLGMTMGVFVAHGDFGSKAFVRKNDKDARAKVVSRELAKSGAGNRQITEAVGYGPEHPVCAANDTPECKAQNRRVDLKVASK